MSDLLVAHLPAVPTPFSHLWHHLLSLVAAAVGAANVLQAQQHVIIL
jgi:hypothetical protein